MENTEKLTKLIIKLEKSRAVAFLEEIEKDISCRNYAQAREKILLVEAAKELNRRLPAFYIDVKSFAENLFSQNSPSTRKTIDILCQAVKAADKENKKRAFEKALSYMEENICNNQLAIGDAAEYAGISSSVLTKLFTENMGITPLDYLGRLRIEKSMEFLKTDSTIEQVAKRVGYTSTETYIRAFKRIMGITPGVWKRNNLFL